MQSAKPVSSCALPLKIAWIGCGRIFAEGHLPAFLAAPPGLAEVVGLVDADARRLELARVALGTSTAHCFAHHRILLNEVSVDAVIVATPHRLHAAAVTDALGEEIAILCEKPLAPTLSECRQLVQRAISKRVPLAVMHNYRHSSLWRAVYEIVQRGEIGRALHFEVRTSAPSPLPGFTPNRAMWRLEPQLAGRGCLLDQGYHYFYLAEHLLGSPAIEIGARMGCTNDRLLDDYAEVEVRHSSGARSDIRVDWRTPGPPRSVHRLHGTHGLIAIDEDPARITVLRGDHWLKEAPVPADDPYGFTGSLVGSLIAIADKGPLPADGEDGIRTMTLVEASYESARRGRVVPIDRLAEIAAGAVSGT